MATNTFERKIVISDSASKEKLAKVLESTEPARKQTKPLYSGAERERSEELLARCLSRPNADMLYDFYRQQNELEYGTWNRNELARLLNKQSRFLIYTGGE